MRLNIIVGGFLAAFIFAIGNIIFFGYAKEGLLSSIVYFLFCLNLMIAILFFFRAELGFMFLAINATLIVLLALSMSFMAQTLLAYMGQDEMRMSLESEVSELQSSNEYYESYGAYLHTKVEALHNTSEVVAANVAQLERQKAAIPNKPKEIIEYNYVNVTFNVTGEQPPPVYYYVDEEYDREYEEDEREEEDD